MAIKRQVKKAVRKVVAKVNDPATRKQVAAALKQGKDTILRYEKELTSPATRRKLKAQWKHAKADLQHLKVEAQKKGKQALAYTQKKPGQALALAAAVGLATGIVVTALRRRKA